MTDEPAPGPVQAQTQAVVADMGVLHGVQPALAAAALDLAREIDGGAKTSDRYRELRMTLRDLWDLRHFGVGDPQGDEQLGEAPPEPAPAVDPIDEIGARRRQRTGDAG